MVDDNDEKRAKRHANGTTNIPKYITLFLIVDNVTIDYPTIAQTIPFIYPKN